MAGDKYIKLGTDGILAEQAATQAGGTGNENKIPALDSSGKLDSSMVPTGSNDHARKHDLNGTNDHTGISGTTGNFMALNSSGLPVDSNKAPGDFSGHEHNHDLAYLGIAAKAADADKLDGVDGSGYSISGHSHANDHARKHNLDGTDDHTGISGTAGNFMALSASGLPTDSNKKAADFSDAGHNHNLTYLGISAVAADSDKLDGQDGSYYAAASALHTRAHAIDSSSDHSAATGANKGKYVRSNSSTGNIEFGADVDTFISSKAQASGLASLDGSSLVVQNPANATATPTASKIPIADGTGKLASGWLTTSSQSASGIIEIADNTEAVAASSTSLALCPGNLSVIFASPPAIGSTAPNTGKFTTLTTTGLATLQGDGISFANASTRPTGALRTVGVYAGGSKYVVGDILTVVQSGASGGQVKVESVRTLDGTTGIVQTISVYAGGSGYTAPYMGPARTTTGGTAGSSGCTVYIKGVTRASIIYPTAGVESVIDGNISIGGHVGIGSTIIKGIIPQGFQAGYSLVIKDEFDGSAGLGVGVGAYPLHVLKTTTNDYVGTGISGYNLAEGVNFGTGCSLFGLNFGGYGSVMSGASLGSLTTTIVGAENFGIDGTATALSQDVIGIRTYAKGTSGNPPLTSTTLYGIIVAASGNNENDSIINDVEQVIEAPASRATNKFQQCLMGTGDTTGTWYNWTLPSVSGQNWFKVYASAASTGRLAVDVSGVKTDVATITSVSLAAEKILESNDGRRVHVNEVITTPVTLDTTYEVVVCNSTSAIVLNLPAATGSGQKYIIKNVNTGAVTVTANTGGTADTIDGLATLVLGQYDSRQIVDYASDKWAIL